MIDVRKINLTLPDGVVTEGEISISGNIATVNVISSTVGDKVIKASYDNGSEVSTILRVTEEVLFSSLATEPANKCFTGDVVKVIAAFTKPPQLVDVEITPPAGFTVKAEPKIEGVNVVAEYIAPDDTIQGGEFTVNFRHNTSVKTANMVVIEKPAELQTVEADPASIRISEVTTLTATFNKAPKLSEVIITVPEGLVVKEAAKVIKNTVVAKYQGSIVGDKNVKVEHNGVSKNITISVLADAIVSNVVADPDSIKLGESSVVTVTYDKPRLENQPPMEVKLDAGLAEKLPYTENPEKNGGTIQVVGSEQGDKSITFTLGGKSKVVKITVNPGV